MTTVTNSPALKNDNTWLCKAKPFKCSLKLQPRKVALLIGNLRVKCKNWDNKFSVERSLAQLLRRNRKDLCIENVSWLPSGTFLKRLLITSQKTDLPSDLLSRSSQLWKFHIIPTRVFEDTNHLHLVQRHPAPLTLIQLENPESQLTLPGQQQPITPGKHPEEQETPTVWGLNPASSPQRVDCPFLPPRDARSQFTPKLPVLSLWEDNPAPCQPEIAS